MKKIIIVNNNLKIGGIQKSLVNLLNEIHEKYEITLFLFNRSGEYINEVPDNVTIIEAKLPLKILGMSLQECKDKGFLYLLLKYIFTILTKVFSNRVSINLIISFQPKINNYNYAISYMQSSPSKQFYSGTNEFVLKRIVSDKKMALIHCDFGNYGGNIEYDKKIYDKFNKIVFCSKGCLNSFTNVLPSLKPKTGVIYNFHNIKKIISLSNQSPVIYKNKKYNVVLVSRMSFSKGIDTALYALAHYNENFKDNIHMNIIGDGKDLSELRKLATKLNINNSVTFYGSRTNPYRYIKNSDLLLLTSKFEAAPMVFGEASILKIPILATKSISTDELILDPNVGLVCNYDVKSIADHLDRIFNKVGIKNIIKNINKDYKSLNSIALKQFIQEIGI